MHDRCYVTRTVDKKPQIKMIDFNFMLDNNLHVLKNKELRTVLYPRDVRNWGRNSVIHVCRLVLLQQWNMKG